MCLEERGYSILVVSAAENVASALSALLSEYALSPPCQVSSISAAKRAVAERAFDFVLINSPLPDDPGVRFAMDVSATKGAVALLLVRADMQAATFDKVVGHGVFTLSKPTSRSMLAQALAWLASARERIRQFEKKTVSIEEKMEEIRLVNRAKWLLIAELKMDEPDAHRYIEKQAMDRCVSRKTVAQDIIKTYA